MYSLYSAKGGFYITKLRCPAHFGGIKHLYKMSNPINCLNWKNIYKIL